MYLDKKNMPSPIFDALPLIVDTIKDVVPTDMILLYGSFARGDWVRDRVREPKDTLTYTYESDIDILVVVPNQRYIRDFDLEKKVCAVVKARTGLKDIPSLVFETSPNFIKAVSEGSYFYLDILKEGQILYQNPLFNAVTLPSPDLIKEAVARDFGFWYEKAHDFLNDYAHNSQDGVLNNAAFHLSQAAECFVVAALTITTGYKPKSHSLEKLLNGLNTFLPIVAEIFPINTDLEKKRFELLKKAYIDARYKKDYQILPEDLKYLRERVAMLEKKVREYYDLRVETLARA